MNCKHCGSGDCLEVQSGNEHDGVITENYVCTNCNRQGTLTVRATDEGYLESYEGCLTDGDAL